MSDKKKHIAIVYEGEKTEKALIERLQMLFFADIMETVVISFPASGNIYMLWNKLREYEFDVDIIDVIREMNKETKELLEGYSARDFSEVYLFFDYDAHNDNLPQIYKNRDTVRELLETFDNETENGKLYISYPMIESLREIHSENEDYKSFYVSLDERYKNYVSEELEFQNFKHITKEQWEVACRASVKRAYLITHYREAIPEYDYFLKEMTQAKIYEAQLEHFVNLNKVVGVLNSVPLFLLEYFDVEFWNRVMAGRKMQERK
jgi:hypothetical protein